ncbi:helix-turn-helix domain-containing protein [Streptococcus halichoeri]|uniref:helix-turn-helix domain-containing protein n=1 Tax=Streptococcus halichoeri TaxID=254785 RepID=UPI00135C6E4A|nr:helix-turn-helix transcriptional regulator [Streptococcus halichoeri]
MIGDTIYQERLKLGMTQENLSAYLNLTKSTISKWENNQAKPDIDYLIHLARLFDMSLDELVGFNSILSAKARKQLFQELKKQGQELSEENFFTNLKLLAKQHLHDSKVILMLVQLALNHFSQLDSKDWALDLLNRIIKKTSLESDLQAAIALKAVILFQQQAYDDIIRLYQDRPYKLGQELLLAHSYAAKGNTAMAKQVLQVEIYQQILLLCEYLASLLTYDDTKEQITISRRLKELMQLFEITSLHPSTAIKSYYALALYYSAKQPDKALACLDQLMKALANLLQSFELHGDAFFYAISDWLDQLPMGTQPPLHKAELLQQIEASLTQPAFKVLHHAPAFQKHLQQIAKLKKELSDDPHQDS